MSAAQWAHTVVISHHAYHATNFTVESFGVTFIFPFKENERLVCTNFYSIYEHVYPLTHPPTLRTRLIQAQIILRGKERPLRTKRAGADCSSLYEPSL